MRARSPLLGVVVTAVVLFVWQSISNAALPWHEASMKTFSSDSAAVASVRAIAPSNGLYFSPRGVLMVASMTPQLADRSQAMGTPMARQILLDLVVAAVLMLVVSRLAAPTPLAVGRLLGLAGLAAGVVSPMSNWNWYGFPASFELVNTVDLGINLFIAGALLAWFTRRGASAGAVASDAGVGAGSGLSPLDARRTTTTS